MNEVTPLLDVLSSMITPAVLILASGSLILTTSQRLSRVLERVRKISQEFMQIEKSDDKESANEKKRKILYTLLSKSVRRCKLLTRAMTLLYVSLGLFVATSLTIGVIAIANLTLTWVPTAFGMTGAVVLFVSSAVLIVESRVTNSVIADEVHFVIESSKTHSPEFEKSAIKRNWRKWLNL